MKNYFKVAGVLGGIALVCAALIALMNLLTSPIIEKNNQKTVNETYTKVYANYDSNKSESVSYTKDANGYIQDKIEAKDASGNVLGYIYTVDGKNSYGEIKLMVGITDGKVVDVEFLTNSESFASTVNSHVKSSYPSSKDSVVDLNPYGKAEDVTVGALDQSGVDSVDVSCGATYGAKLVKALVNAALEDAKGVK